jgi:hypothetical protein
MDGDEGFPSGPWRGFFTYSGNHGRHRMDLGLTFANGVMSGEGNDEVGAFVIRGRYDAKSKECWWTKAYIGQYDAFYRGFREGKGIWGTWEIGQDLHGGFKIWPLAQGAGDDEAETEAVVEAVGELATP